MNQQGLTKLPSLSQLQAPAFGAIPGVDALKMFQSQMQTASGVNTLGMQQAVLQPMAKSSQLPITGTISSVPTATPQPRIQLPFNVQQQQQQPTFIQNPFYSRLAMTNRVGMLQPSTNSTQQIQKKVVTHSRQSIFDTPVKCWKCSCKERAEKLLLFPRPLCVPACHFHFYLTTAFTKAALRRGYITTELGRKDRVCCICGSAKTKHFCSYCSFSYCQTCINSIIRTPGRIGPLVDSRLISIFKKHEPSSSHPWKCYICIISAFLGVPSAREQCIQQWSLEINDDRASEKFFGSRYSRKLLERHGLHKNGQDDEDGWSFDDEADGQERRAKKRKANTDEDHEEITDEDEDEDRGEYDDDDEDLIEDDDDDDDDDDNGENYGERQKGKRSQSKKKKRGQSYLSLRSSREQAQEREESKKKSMAWTITELAESASEDEEKENETIFDASGPAIISKLFDAVEPDCLSVSELAAFHRSLRDATHQFAALNVFGTADLHAALALFGDQAAKVTKLWAKKRELEKRIARRERREKKRSGSEVDADEDEDESSFTFDEEDDLSSTTQEEDSTLLQKVDERIGIEEPLLRERVAGAIEQIQDLATQCERCVTESRARLNALFVTPPPPSKKSITDLFAERERLINRLAHLTNYGEPYKKAKALDPKLASFYKKYLGEDPVNPTKKSKKSSKEKNASNESLSE